MRILLIGKTGQLGGDLLRNCPTGHEVFAPGRDVLDLERLEEIDAAVESFRPQCVINTAAFHNVPLCETEWERALRVNCVAVRRLAAKSRELDAWFVTFSTDYVFGGEKRSPYAEDDRPAPLQTYGITKLAGEFAALATAPERSIVVRTCGLYGVSGARSKGGNFVDQRIREAKEGRSLEISSDQIVCPTYTEDLSAAVWQLLGLRKPSPGIYHLVNEGQCSWYEFTRKIFELLGAAADVRPIDRNGSSDSMRRPLYSVLGNHRAKAAGITLPHWRDALGRYLRAKYSI